MPPRALSEAVVALFISKQRTMFSRKSGSNVILATDHGLSGRSPSLAAPTESHNN
jgi:DhnA family fructose-bisphosphate aldolase class Ia